MSDTSKSSESRSKSRSGGWNPFRKVMSMVTGRQTSDSETTISSEGDKVFLRWTASCLNATCPIFSRNPQFNMIYSPAPSLLMFVIVTLASENAMTKTLQRLFELSDEDIEEIREMSSKLNNIRSPTSFYFFARFLVDEERTTTVSKELMAKSNEVACQQVFASIRPTRAIKYLDSLAFQPITLPRPSLLTTNGYASAGLNATWIGQTKKAGLHRFAANYQKRKLEPFFEIHTSYKRVTTDLFEIFEVPFKTDRVPYGSFLWLRPHFLGHLPYANRQLTTDLLSKIITDLASATWQTGRLLLPQFGASGAFDLWKNLMRHGVQPDLGQSQKAPPMASLWHWARLNVSSEGISGTESRRKSGKMTASQKALQQVCHGRVSGVSLLEKHRTYSCRMDSPFTYMVLVNGIPIFTGSYFGSPPPKSNELFVNAPARIRQRRHSGTQKPKRNVKMTRKQKLLRKVKKSEERERQKDKKREERDRKLQQKRQKKRKSSESSTTTSVSQSVSQSVSESPANSPDVHNDDKIDKIPENQKPRTAKKEKSKSSGWRRFTKIFRKKE